MINSVGNTNSASSTGQTATTKAASDPLASENTFLQLLVTQLKNQDPESPQDGTQFVAQLAQFSGLEQQLQMRQDLDAIKQSVQDPTAAANTNPVS